MTPEEIRTYLTTVPRWSVRNYFHIKLSTGHTPDGLRDDFNQKGFRWEEDLMGKDFPGFINDVIEAVGEDGLKALMLEADKNEITPFYTLLTTPDNFISFMNKYESLAVGLFRTEKDISYLLSRWINLNDKNIILTWVWEHIRAPWLIGRLIDEIQSSADVDTSIVLDLLREHINDSECLPLLLPLLKNYGQENNAVKLCIQKCRENVGFWYRLKLFFNGYFMLAINWNRIANQVHLASWPKVKSAQNATREDGLGVAVRPEDTNSSPQGREQNVPK